MRSKYIFSVFMALLLILTVFTVFTGCGKKDEVVDNQPAATGMSIEVSTEPSSDMANNELSQPMETGIDLGMQLGTNITTVYETKIVVEPNVTNEPDVTTVGEVDIVEQEPITTVIEAEVTEIVESTVEMTRPLITEPYVVEEIIDIVTWIEPGETKGITEMFIDGLKEVERGNVSRVLNDTGSTIQLTVIDGGITDKYILPAYTYNTTGHEGDREGVSLSDYSEGALIIYEYINGIGVLDVFNNNKTVYTGVATLLEDNKRWATGYVYNNTPNTAYITVKGIVDEEFVMLLPGEVMYLGLGTQDLLVE